MADLRRRLAAVLAADVAGYTRLMEQEPLELWLERIGFRHAELVMELRRNQEQKLRHGPGDPDKHKEDDEPGTYFHIESPI